MNEVILDTNIYYYLGDGSIKTEDLSGRKIIGTAVSITELGTTKNLLDKPELVRKAIQSMMTYKEVIPDSPLVHLAKLADSSYDFDSKSALGSMLEGTKMIANGYNVLPDKQKDFEVWLESSRKSVQVATAFIKNALIDIRKNIRDKKAHRREDVTKFNREFIAGIVSSATEGKVNLSGFDWSKVELFDKVLSWYFQQLELGAIGIEDNDWNDLFLLLYVQPGMQYLTYENRWIRLIKQAGMKKYLDHLCVDRVPD